MEMEMEIEVAHRASTRARLRAEGRLFLPQVPPTNNKERAIFLACCFR